MPSHGAGLERIVEEAYRLVEPSREDRARVDSMAGIYLKRVKDAALEYSREVSDVVLVGSYAKDTWLAESVDIDVFVKMRPDVDEERFEHVAMEIGLRALHDAGPYLRYAQHPYVEAVIDGIRVNVVPCYDVEMGRWRSAADRSPYHTEYMLEALDDAKRREVRLLKRFMKVIGVYGAEIAVQGFSGYACEVLILRYGSFIGTLEHASRWRDGEVITLTQVGQVGGGGMVDDSHRRNGYRGSPIVILDPIDTSRNLGSAISYESVGRFILSARNFLRRPSIAYFTYDGRVARAPMIDGGKAMNMVMVHFRHSPRSEDVVWGQLRSSMDAIARQLSINGFRVLRYACYTDGSNAFISFMLDSLSIPRMVLKRGPKVFDAKNSDRFIAKNREKGVLLWVSDEDGRLLALVERRFHHARDMLNHIMGRALESSGMSRGLIDDVRSNGFRVYTWDDVKGYMDGTYSIEGSAVASAVRKIVEYMVVNDRFAFADEPDTC
ncbi:MAG: CCA tRNA nucleotidyltransferase [Candidatus Nitrosocaldus sp.]|nr:CCA tRNA nucleotidyltransferase [Candidatus Nitrosocaldus sp.]